MTENKPIDSSQAFEEALRKKQTASYVLRLFISGQTSKSAQAIQQLRQICETNLKGRYQLEVVDISQKPDLAKKEQIIATPTVIKTLPMPIRRIVGNLSRTEQVLVGLDLQQK